MLAKRFFNRLAASKEVVAVRVTLSLALAAVTGVWSLTLNSFGLSAPQIGFVSAMLVIVSVGVSLLSTPLLERVEAASVLRISLLLLAIGYGAVLLATSLVWFLLLAAIHASLIVLAVNSADIISRIVTPVREFNRMEGMKYAFLNMSWLVGPALAGIIASKMGLLTVYGVGALAAAGAAIVLIATPLPEGARRKRHPDDVLTRNIIDFLKRPDLRAPYLVVMGLELWWSLLYIYLPLVLLAQGATTTVIGLFLSAAVIPLIGLEYVVGALSRKQGFRRFLIVGFVGLALTASMLVVFSGSIAALMIIVVIGSVFASCIEPLQNSFFFHYVRDGEEEKYYPVFGTARDLGNAAARLTIAGILAFLPITFAYGFIAVVFAALVLMLISLKGSMMPG